MLDAPYHIDRPYTYLVPETFVGQLAPGRLVRVPFGRGDRSAPGLVTELTEGDGEGLKSIASLMPERCALVGEQLGLCLFLAEHTLSTVGEAVRALLPPTLLSDRPNIKTARIYTPASAELLRAALSESGKRKIRSEGQRGILSFFLENPTPTSADALAEAGCAVTPAWLSALVEKGYLAVSEREMIRNPYAAYARSRSTEPIVLSRAQMRAYSTITELPTEEPQAVLLHGVTGSGKTKVIMKLLDRTLDAGKTAIVMVPEIALTPQTVGIFCSRYGERVAVIHSSLGAGERFDAWRRIAAGEVSLVIGTRSAVFAPLSNLGLIVIDEEHEHTYKSESDPKYHTRDVAAYRCGKNSAMLLLASATPSLESYSKAKRGIYTLVELSERYGGATLPDTEVVDLRDELRRGNTSPISASLAEALRETVSRGEQAILFLNRRGYNSSLQCKRCGEVISCPHCSISLTYHSSGSGGFLLCHCCGYRTNPPRECPSCGSDLISYLGFGTQKAEAELTAALSGCRVMRMDADTTSGKQSYDRMLDAFRRGEADVLLGTQMVTKGHDFPNVTLVGVLLADASLYVNDFRASERTFALLTQVIGRAGRASRKGRAIVQTYAPDNEVLRLAMAQDYPAFYASEVAVRRETTFPPFCDLALLLLTSSDEAALLRAATELRGELLSRASGEYRDLPLTVFGPFEAQIYKISEKYRMRMVLKCRNSPRLRALLRALLLAFGKNREVTLSVDLGPLSV
jgi:primosomal protein N' (replication factor Y)